MLKKKIQFFNKGALVLMGMFFVFILVALTISSNKSYTFGIKSFFGEVNFYPHVSPPENKNLAKSD